MRLGIVRLAWTCKSHERPRFEEFCCDGGLVAEFFSSYRTQLSTEWTSLSHCHCPDAGVSVGIDLARIWSTQGGCEV